MSAGYQKDLAFIHDVGFGFFATKAAPNLLRILHQYRVKKGLVVDLGCGSGIWAQQLVGAGYDVLGIDFSPAMIKLARKREPKARFQTGSFLTAQLPECDVVTSLGECFNYLFDQSNGKKRLSELFRRVFEALRPGGLFIFDMIGPGHERGANPRRGFWEGQDWAILVQVSENTKKRELVREIVTFRKTGNLYRRSVESHYLRLYPSSEIARQLRQAGFRVRVLRGYGDFRFTGAHSGFLARKP
ncbi:MAG: class I SAM-dependent methyltransferase [Acidobacteriota bacterium]